MIHRYVYPEDPPKVEYSLTEIGREFIPVLKQFDSFGTKYITYLKSKETTEK
jgi:DNA-binding HxlR family transcriptional regulator